MIDQKKILIVDDAKISRERIANILAKAGFVDITEACDGEEGLRIYKDKLPDIVFLDLIMPKMDGRSLLNEIDSVKTKVIIVSTVNQEGIKEKLSELGSSGFINKPFEEDEILRAVGIL